MSDGGTEFSQFRTGRDKVRQSGKKKQTSKPSTQPASYDPQAATRAADQKAYDAEQARIKQDTAASVDLGPKGNIPDITLYQSPLANNTFDPTKAGTWPVYFDTAGSTSVADHQIDTHQSTYGNVDQSLGALYGMSQDQISSLQDKLFAAGYLQKGFLKGIADSQTADAYKNLLLDAAQRVQAGRYVTLDDVLAERAAAVTAAGGPTGTGKKNSTSVTLTNPIEANDAIDKAYEAHLGRRASPQEKAAFLTALQTAERNNPHQTNYTLDPTTGNTQDETVAQGIGGWGNVDAATFADQYAQSGAAGVEANTHAAATTYYNAALNLIGVRQ